MPKMTVEFSKTELENLLSKVLRSDYGLELLNLDFKYEGRFEEAEVVGVTVEVVVKGK